MAEAIARQAVAAFEAGDFARAAQLYRSAASQDATHLEYIFGAARSEHIGGRTLDAEVLYEQFLKDARHSDPKRVQKAKQYVAEIRAARGMTHAMEAETAFKSGDSSLAAQLWLDAFQLAPTRWEFLFQSAVAAKAAGRDADATSRIQSYLASAPSDAPDRAQAKLRLVTWQQGAAKGKKSEIAKVEPAAREPLAAKVEDRSAGAKKSGSRTGTEAFEATAGEPKSAAGPGYPVLGKALVGVGVALAVLGGSYAGYTFAHNDGKCATDQCATDAQTRFDAALVVAGVGVGSAIVGAVLWEKSPTDPTVVLVTPGGVLLSGRW